MLFKIRSRCFGENYRLHRASAGELAYQKQVNLETNEITGIEALLRLRMEMGDTANDEIIPQIEGESLFSLVVLESLLQLEKFFAIKEEIGLKDATLYLNVSAHTIMHPEFAQFLQILLKNINLGLINLVLRLQKLQSLQTSILPLNL